MSNPRTAVALLANVAAGLAAGILLHYLLYRFAIPAKPFIYVSF